MGYHPTAMYAKAFILYKGSLHTSQISHLLLYLHFANWLLVPESSSHFCRCFLYNLLLRSALVSTIVGKWPKDFRDPYWYSTCSWIHKVGQLWLWGKETLWRVLGHTLPYNINVLSLWAPLVTVCCCISCPRYIFLMGAVSMCICIVKCLYRPL